MALIYSSTQALYNVYLNFMDAMKSHLEAALYKISSPSAC